MIEYLLMEIFRIAGLPILIGVAITLIFFRIREHNINKREDE